MDVQYCFPRNNTKGLSNAHSRSYSAMSMIDLGRGAVHLSSEPGAGRTTLCLNMANDVLESGGRVIWSCMKTPDQVRFSKIMEDLDRDRLMDFRVIEFGNHLAMIEEVLIENIRHLETDDLVIIDDWCGPTGRAKKVEIDSLIRIIETSDCGVIATSSAVVNASGSGPGLVARGGVVISAKMRSLMLLGHPTRESHRILSDDSGDILLRMDEYGLSPV